MSARVESYTSFPASAFIYREFAIFAAHGACCCSYCAAAAAAAGIFRARERGPGKPFLVCQPMSAAIPARVCERAVFLELFREEVCVSV